VFVNVNAWLLGLVRMRIKAAVPPFVDLRVQSVPRLIDKIGPIFDE
jgi:hypothetical protein